MNLVLARIAAGAILVAVLVPGSASFAKSSVSPQHPRFGITLGQLQNAYGFSPLYKLGYTGQGQVIAVVEGAVDPAYIAHNMALFDAHYHLPPVNIHYLYPGGRYVSKKWNGEDNLDVSLIHGLAPGAVIDLVVEKNPLTAFRYIVAHHLAHIVSYSANTVESRFTHAEIQAYDGVLQQMALHGIGIYKGIGDWGALDNNPKGWPKLDTAHFKVNFPASSPFVTAVGGTTLQATSAGAYIGESVWAKSGGGFSEWFSRPSWQKAPGIATTQTKRGIPDVAFDANPKTGLLLYEKSRLVPVGGDSAGGPAWSAIAALANEVAKRPLGFLNPRLYAIARSPYYHLAFHDVVKGGNGYAARPGWDPATGLGSPHVYELVKLLTVGAKRALPTH